MKHPQRLRDLRERIAAAGVDSLLVTKPENVRYISGFAGSSGCLLVTQDRAQLVSDSRYEIQAREQAPGFEFVRAQRMDEGMSKAVADAGVRSLGFEPGHVTFSTYSELERALPQVRLVALPEAVEAMRLVKDDEELALIRRACEIADDAMARVVERVAAGRSEKELALEAEVFMRRAGAEKAAFDVIVASGPRSAMPHATPSDRLIEEGDLVIVDLGARYEGYNSDLTRTVAVGEASDEARRIYSLCHRAQAEGLRAVRAGAICPQVDAQARKVIEKGEYGRYFGHGLGHGVGLEIHEAPRLAPTEKERALAEGMVVTVEPGIYLPEVGGVRIEDLVLVRGEGAECMTSSPKPSELLEV